MREMWGTESQKFASDMEKGDYLSRPLEISSGTCYYLQSAVVAMVNHHVWEPENVPFFSGKKLAGVAQSPSDQYNTETIYASLQTMFAREYHPLSSEPPQISLNYREVDALGKAIKLLKTETRETCMQMPGYAVDITQSYLGAFLDLHSAFVQAKGRPNVHLRNEFTNAQQFIATIPQVTSDRHG